jgi:hypothetical protein
MNLCEKRGGRRICCVIIWVNFCVASQLVICEKKRNAQEETASAAKSDKLSNKTRSEYMLL